MSWYGRIMMEDFERRRGMLVSDYTHPTPHGGHCRVRIFERGRVTKLVPKWPLHATFA
jgi:hypothetical protein